MEDEPEVIRQQMQDSRTALTEKLEALESRVTGTVEAVTTTVTETVQAAKEAVSDTVQTVKENVAGTVDAVKDTVGGAVESVRQTLDVNAQTERHPWLMFGGAVAVGFAVGAVLPSSRRASGGPGMIQSAWESVAGGSVPHGHTSSESRLAAGMASASGHVPHRDESSSWFAGESHPASSGPGLFASLGQMFGPEFDRLKGMALGMAMGVARDLIVKSVPPNLTAQVHDLVDDVTRKLGGEPVREQHRPV